MLAQRYSTLSTKAKKALREDYASFQDGKCWHCQQPLDGPSGIDHNQLPLNMNRFPPHFLKYPVHLHHSHETDMTIGAVHAYCNGVLWQYHGE